MNGRLVAITSDELLALCSKLYSAEDIDTTMRYGRLSDPIFAGWFGTELICLVGFAPRSTLSDVAYLWLITTLEASRHPTLVGRWGKRLVEMALHRYPTLVGHCMNNSERWLTSLGATLGPLDMGHTTFRIGA